MAKVSTPAILQAREFLESFEILAPQLQTAAIYARIRADLKNAGITIPDPDYWIAAHAIEERLPLLSTDRHFNYIPGINLHLIKG